MTPLQRFLEAHPRLFVLTGAGCSTDSGIPDYRDRDGQWKRPPPVNYGAFMHEPATRRRYWARSMVGWRRFGHAQPNAAHHALSRLERRGQVVTHREIILAVWGDLDRADAQFVRVLAGQVRHKVEENPSDPRLIVTVPGVGYQFGETASEPDAAAPAGAHS